MMVFVLITFHVPQANIILSICLLYIRLTTNYYNTKLLVRPLEYFSTYLAVSVTQSFL